MTCMHKTRLLAARRLYRFKKQVSWEKYINECFLTYVGSLGQADLILCPDPNCSIVYELEHELWYHLQDSHSYPLQDVRTKTEKGRNIFVDGGCSLVGRKRC